MSIFSSRTREVHVAVAVVYDPQREKFLVVLNPRWGGYTFPLRRKRRSVTDDALRDRNLAVLDAQMALVEDLGPVLGRTREAHWMDRIQVLGVSGRSEKPTRYTYDIVTLIPEEQLPEGQFGSRFGFLTADEIRRADPDDLEPNGLAVTWTTWQVLTRLLDNQNAAVSVVCRRNDGQREYLMTRNRRGQWFFPSTRLGDGVRSERLAVLEFKEKADYSGTVELAGDGAEVELEQMTPHLGTRNYVFHLHQLRFPNVDLCEVGNPLEMAMRRVGLDFQWVHESRLSGNDPELSDTVRGIADSVLGMVPACG